MDAPGRVTFLIVALAGFPVRADEPCTPEARRRLPAAEEFAQLCPKDPVFANAPREKPDPRGGCQLSFHADPTRFVRVAAARQEPRVSGGPRKGAEKAAEHLAKYGGGKAPAVRRMGWASVEAWTLEGTRAWYVDSGGDVLVVSVNVMFAKPPSDACTEAIVREVAKRFGGR